MKFRVVKPWKKLTTDSDEILAVLITDKWDDHGFKTTFELEIMLPDGLTKKIGYVSIAYEGMKEGSTSSKIDREFDELPPNYFSLGFKDTYYANLKQLGSEVLEEVLSGLRDLALDISRFDELVKDSSKNPVIEESLLRHNKADNVRTQLHRIALGGPRFHGFTLNVPVGFENRSELTFSVQPGKCPSKNVHALIGTNGVGKTHQISEIINSVIGDGTPAEIDSEENELECLNVVLVAFSPFDWKASFAGADDLFTEKSRFSFIGLAKFKNAEAGKNSEISIENKSHEELKEEFADYVEMCKQRGKLDWLRSALSKLESDPLLASNEAYLQAAQAVKIHSDRLAEEFSNLSSGHKIVLLTVAALAAEVDEGTLVLVDEPENHLHPPLLSSFIRALSELLYDRNGLAIVGTHSPVVLQEIPRDCVWKLYRSGDVATAERPRIETFGENVGVLTREVFGLQVRESGFYRMLTEAVAKAKSYEEVVEMFEGQLGGEAKALVRVLLASKE